MSDRGLGQSNDFPARVLRRAIRRGQDGNGDRLDMKLQRLGHRDGLQAWRPADAEQQATAEKPESSVGVLLREEVDGLVHRWRGRPNSTESR